MTTNNTFQFIDDDKVPSAIKPMTELHDKLVMGYAEDRELKLPKLIYSLEKRITTQVNELVKLENEIQDGNEKIHEILNVIRKIMMSKEVPKKVSKALYEEFNKLYGN